MSQLRDISHQELLNELLHRFNESKRTMEQQKELMEQLESVNEKLLESEGLKSQFLSNIRNEINNPLTSISGLSGNLMKMADSDQIKSLVGMIYSESINLQFQLQNIFMAAEIESGEVRPNVMKVDVPTLVEKVISSFQHLIDKKKLNIDFQNQLTNAEDIVSDPEKITLITSNLLKNAIEFSNLNSVITIVVGGNKEELVIEVSDCGIGIGEENLDLIFDRFRQLDVGTTKKYGGHGLGLAVVKSLLELLGGEIKVQSTLNKGSTFSIHIPQSEENIQEGLSTGGNEFLFEETELF